ncbi:hypothetical protein GGD92_20420 [Pseudomonas protegens]|uniref:YcxB-like protein domain-containing protein n=1 Tax=Pseudomonas protegens TaxID=380021 RepID=A0A7G7XKL2_9PSED|nr:MULTISPECIES: hypothetical protein [Pseudomonas]MDF2395114.1 hypothetical protein [Pseudomonas sp. 3MA1]QNH80507.1 hypothetical protein GGI48_15495 [Pseudomonas protegens]QNL03934.1 hypothetical protein GGD92_20420 [Pseudomonas protegens]
MELHYRITPAHTEAWIAEPLKQELLKDDQQHVRVMSTFARWQSRLIGPVMFTLCLIGGCLSIYFPERTFTPEKVIAMVAFALIFIPLWWRFSGRWIKHLQARIAATPIKPQAPLRGLNQRLIEARLRAPLKATEGTYTLTFDDQGFTLSKLPRAKSSLTWEQVVYLREAAHFYDVASAEMQRKGQACRIAKHSELMDDEAYQQGLQAFLSHCPVAPSAT